LIELYIRKIWNDPKVANIIASGCFNSNYKVRLLSAYFLITTTETKKEEFSSSDEGEEGTYIPKQGHSKSVKPSKAREHRVQREKKRAMKKQRKRFSRLTGTEFFPLDLIHSHQDFADRLFAQVRKLQGDKFECKMASLAVIARLINRNKLMLIPFYTFL
jgi:protein SDA1